MVDGIAGGGRGRIDAARTQAAQRISTLARPKPVQLAPDTGPTLTVAGSATTLAKAGPPVDAEKVARIKAAIVGGRYPIDVRAIAEKMIDLDLGPLA